MFCDDAEASKQEKYYLIKYLQDIKIKFCLIYLSKSWLVVL